MYAKLIAGVGISASNMIRDIIRLCVSNSPSTSDLGAFDSGTSVIIDDTPAGWTYVYSNVDTGTLGGTGSSASTGNGDWWAMSAPCLGPSVSTVKYAKFTTTGVTPGVTSTEFENSGFTLTSAESISGATVTNESYRLTISSSAYDNWTNYLMDIRGTGIYHLIATERHITIIKEGIAIQAVWETTIPDSYVFNDTPPVLNYVNSLQKGSSNSTGFFNGGSSPIEDGYGTNVGPTSASSVSSYSTNQYASLYNIYDPNTTTVYGSITISPGQNGAVVHNNGAHPYLFPANSSRGYTVNSSGQTKNIVSPVFFSLMRFGIPTVFVTGVCDIYMTKGGIGIAGDIIQIDGVDYTYFPLYNATLTDAQNTSFMGLAMLTS